jgi:AcrR family transcriptional regulator
MSGSIWTRQEVASNTGRPAEHGRPQITAAAIVVAASEGLAAVTMRRVAAELGTGAATLYRHLTTRDDLLDLMIDQAYAELEPPPVTGDWRSDVVADQLTNVGFLRARPWLVDALWTRPALAHAGPNVLRHVEALLERLAAYPAPGWAKMEAVGVLNGMVQTYVHAERRGPLMGEAHLVELGAHLMRVAADGAHPRLAAAMTDQAPGAAEPPDERLARVFGLVLDGLLPA